MSTRLTIKLSVVLFNDGSAVADNVKIFLGFPGVCLLQDDDDVPPEPTPPAAPPKPTSIIDVLSPHHRLYNMPHLVPAIRPIPRTHAARGNILGPDITHGERDRARFDIEQAMHHVPEVLPTLYLTFASYDDAASFEIDCQIHAAKLPHNESQKLHVVIKKMEGASEGNAVQAI